MYYIILHAEEVVGYTTIMPMSQEKILAILDDKAFLRDIKPEDLDQFKPGKKLYIYIGTMRTKPNISKTEKRAYGVRLIGGLITTIMEMSEKGIDIDTIYARSKTVDGIRVLKHMGFTEISSTTHYKNYSLTMDKEGKIPWQKYEQAFKKKKTSNSIF